ncbi:MAG: hypothetical protein U0136_00780 [Bdellovibrionota bacterium]
MSVRRKTAGMYERGVTMVEGSFVVFSVMLVTLTFIDFARYYATKALLLKGAQDAVDFAVKAPGFDVDTYTLTSTSADDQAKLNRLKQLRIQMGDQTINLARQSFVSAIDESSKRMGVTDTFSLTDQLNGSTSSQTALHAIVLRPGESAQRSDGTWLHHPFRCAANAPSNDPGCPNALRRKGNETMMGLLRDLPIMVRTEATVIPISPWMIRLPIQISVFAWREIPASGGYREGISTGAPPPPPDDPRQDSDCTPVTTCPSGQMPDGCYCVPACQSASECAARNLIYDGWCHCMGIGS